MIPAYVDALCKEIEFVGLNAERSRSDSEGAVEVHTIFFGGGTPSLLTPKQFESIFNSIHSTFDLTLDAEITIEANPGTVTYEALCQLKGIGINRISFGVQSANSFELKMLERTHDFFTVIEAVTSARKAGFDNLNLDLIYGLPEQTLSTWQTTVQRILDLHPEHISAYALTLEHGTPFGRWASKGILPLPDPDLAAEMYEWASETFEANGYMNYEISNWAKTKAEGGMQNNKEHSSPRRAQDTAFSIHQSSFACRHNLQYWRSLPYLAFGAGAHGYANGYRYSNVLRIKTYMDRLADSDTRISTSYPKGNIEFPLSPATVNQHKQTLKDDMSEFMMTGLRLTQEGVSVAEFENRFDQKIETVFGREIQELLKFGLLESKTSEVSETSEVLCLTKRGRLLGNQVFMRFV